MFSYKVSKIKFFKALFLFQEGIKRCSPKNERKKKRFWGPGKKWIQHGKCKGNDDVNFCMVGVKII